MKTIFLVVSALVVAGCNSRGACEIKLPNSTEKTCADDMSKSACEEGHDSFTGGKTCAQLGYKK